MRRRKLRSAQDGQKRVARNQRFRMLMLEMLNSRLCLAADLNCSSLFSLETPIDLAGSHLEDYSLIESLNSSFEPLHRDTIFEKDSSSVDEYSSGDIPVTLETETLSPDTIDIQIVPTMELDVDLSRNGEIASPSTPTDELLEEEWFFQEPSQDVSHFVELVIDGPIDIPEDTMLEDFDDSFPWEISDPSSDFIVLDVKDEPDSAVDAESHLVMDIGQIVTPREVVQEIASDNSNSLGPDALSTAVKDSKADKPNVDSARDILLPAMILVSEYGPFPSRGTETESSVTVVISMDPVAPDPPKTIEPPIDQSRDLQNLDTDGKKHPLRDSMNGILSGIPVTVDAVEFDGKLMGETQSGFVLGAFGLDDTSAVMAVFSSQELFMTPTWEFESLMMHLQNFNTVTDSSDPSESLQFFVEADECRGEDVELEVVSANAEAFQYFELATDADPIMETSIAQLTIRQVAVPYASSVSNSIGWTGDGEFKVPRMVKETLPDSDGHSTTSTRIAMNLAQGILASAIAFRFAIRYREKNGIDQKPQFSAEFIEDNYSEQD